MKTVVLQYEDQGGSFHEEYREAADMAAAKQETKAAALYCITNNFSILKITIEEAF